MFTRRDSMALGLGAAAVTLIPSVASATPFDDAIAAFTGGAPIAEGGVVITAPEIAENGNTVPIEVEAAGATAIMIFASKNPVPSVATFNFGEAAGSSRASIRIRLGSTQEVMAIAKLADGSFTKSQVAVQVTIGGCTG